MNPSSERHIVKTDYLLNTIVMKKGLWILIFSIFTLGSFGQKSLDGIFEDYSGKKGYVTFDISGNLFSFGSLLADDYKKGEGLKDSSISRIRILSLDEKENVDPDFYSDVIELLEKMRYEELMVINSHGTKAKIMVKAEGKLFSELVLLVGGDENVLIQVKGQLTRGDARILSHELASENLNKTR